MTTAIDSNFLIALWDADSDTNSAIRATLDAALDQGPLVIAAPVFAELLAAPSRSAAFLDEFCRHTGIQVDWELGEAIWRSAGEAFCGYAVRRRLGRERGARRILTDFLIGAHANENGYRLLTLDQRIYRAAFPNLRLVRL